MPWSNQGGGGGGGPWGGGGGGRGGPNPWGRPSGGGGGPQPPNIEEILKRSQDRLRRVMPGGFGSGKGLALVGIVILAIWGASGFYRVQPDEQGVVLRFGEWVRTTQPGLNYHLPVPIERVLTPKVTRVNSLDIGFRGTPDARGTGRSRSVPEEGLMLTGDENILDIQYTVFWQIKDAGQFLFNIASPEATVKAAAESSMREVVGNVQAQFALAEGRPQIEQAAQKLLQSVLDDYGAGVLVTQLQLRGVEPPQQVIDAFRDVQRAQADRERARNEAEAYRNEVVAQAQGEAARFVSVYTAYKQAEDVTKQRLYLETMEEILRGVNKVIVDQALGGNGIVPYLPLNELRQPPRRTAPQPQQGAPAQAQGGR